MAENMASNHQTESTPPTNSMDEMAISGDGEGEKIQNDVEDDVVDPWKVESKSAKGVDYDKLISEH